MTSSQEQSSQPTIRQTQKQGRTYEEEAQRLPFHGGLMLWKTLDLSRWSKISDWVVNSLSLIMDETSFERHCLNIHRTIVMMAA